jgi:Putative transposase
VRGARTSAGTVHRIALPPSRRRSIEDGPVCCRDQDAPDQRWQTMTLLAPECSRRLLPPVRPQGFHTVRADGLWSPVPRLRLHPRQLARARTLPTHGAGVPPVPATRPAGGIAQPPATGGVGAPRLV